MRDRFVDPEVITVWSIVASPSPARRQPVASPSPARRQPVATFFGSPVGLSLAAPIVGVASA
jgi:hypothetical protein